MTIAKIHGSEYPIRKIFSNDFNFKVPLYQRPYSWTTEQAGELLDDLVSFIESDSVASIDELSPYFLGSIVLIKEESYPEAEVVDGQQRLTTLTILLSALRQTITTPEYSGGMTDYLYQEGKPLEGTPNRYRLELRERDAKFFRTHILDAGQIVALKKLNAGQLSDSQQNIRANAMLYLEVLGKMSEDQRVRLAQFVVKNCLLVVVSTPDLDSAYRTFSILNDRGLDLSHSDILKSEVIGRIPAKEQEAFNDNWEEAEEELGRDAFSDLFAHTRMIFRRAKAKESILKEFREFVIKKVAGSKALINDVLIPFADAFATIQTASYQSTVGAEQVNQMLAWLGRIDNTDWIPPAIFYFARNKSDAKALHRFLADLERLAAFLMICRYGINERIERYGKLLEAIDTNADLYDADSPLQMSDTEYRLLLQELNGEVYLQVAQRRLYILLRLDSALSDGSATYDHSVISIEHVLPQSPPPASKWCEWFPTQDLRDHWLHRLGNLLLLNHKKNSSASNYEFDKKKTAYFTKGVSPFPLTIQAVGEKEWTAAVVEARQKALLEVLKKVWRVKGEIPTALDFPVEADPISGRKKRTPTVKTQSLSKVIEACEWFATFDRSERKKASGATANAIKLLWERTGASGTDSQSKDFLDRHKKLLGMVAHLVQENRDWGLTVLKVQPGNCAALAYLMAASDTDGDVYHNPKGNADPSEKLIDLAHWDKAQEFFTLLVQTPHLPDENGIRRGSEEFFPVVDTLAMIEDDEEAGNEGEQTSGWATPPRQRRHAILVKAWNAWKGNGTITAEDVALEDVTDPNTGLRHLVENPKIGGIDLGEGNATGGPQFALNPR